MRRLVGRVSRAEFVFTVIFLLASLMMTQDASAIKNLPVGGSALFNMCQEYIGSDREFCCKDSAQTCTNLCGPVSTQDCINACADAEHQCKQGNTVVQEFWQPGEPLEPYETGPHNLQVHPGSPGEPARITPIPE
jgi:hypothetical protein